MAGNELTGKLTLVTGAARGIGRAVSRELLGAGARVVIADIDLAAAEATRDELSMHGEVHTAKLDVTLGDEFEAVVAKIEQERGPIDVLVNNAGIMVIGAFSEIDPAIERREVDINLFGVLNGMRAVLPRMQARGSGHVVNIASLAGRVGMPRAIAYSATKFGVIGATEAARAELRGRGVDFTYVMPYFVRTDLVSGTRPLRWPPMVSPDDVACAVVRGIKDKQLEVYVPRIGRMTALLPQILPRALTDLVSSTLGLYQLFQNVNVNERAAYVARTEDSSAARSGSRPRSGRAKPSRVTGS